MSLTASPKTEPLLRTAAGARRAETIVLETAREAAHRLLDEPATLRPVVIVVPSRSLRLHLMERLVATSPAGALVGVDCVTHFALALRIVERLGLRAPRGLDLFALLARRFARREPALADSLEQLREGYSGILGAVRDLLDAGLEAAHLEAVEEVVEAEAPEVASADESARAVALARITVRTLAAFEELGVGRGSTLLQMATEGLRARPDEALIVDRILLHGFADATGVTSDFLQALLRTYGGLAVIDRPPDPVAPERADASAVFTDRLLERLSAVCELAAPATDASESGLELFRALGREAEVREVAHRCLDLTAAGTRPESIGIVMRDPAPYLGLLRGTLDELGVPFSGQDLSGPPTRAGRRLRALAELVTLGSRTHVERWLDARPVRREETALFDLRVALASLGVSRLEDLARLDLERCLDGDRYPLPVRQGFFEAEEETEGRRVIRARRRSVPSEALYAAVAGAEQIRRLFEAWSEESLPLPDHLGHLATLVGLLGWRTDDAESAELSRLVESIRLAPPIAIEQEELALTLRRLTAEAGRDEFAGNGGGVQVMGVVDARGRTFEHLFVLGMNRGIFPRTIREDPMLSDSLRKLFAGGGHGLLPDLPVKSRGYEEERYLFAQLLSSSPRVTLSWLETDDEDRSLPPSPLIERLRWCHPDRDEAWRSPPLVGRQPMIDLDAHGRPPARRLERLPPTHQATLWALHGRRRELAEAWTALAAARPGDEGLDTDAVVAARVAVLDELDPTSTNAARRGLGPYFGFVGPAGEGDPRSESRLYVTLLERLATCPWQAFIERVLRIEAVPDPLEALPRIDALLIGTLVHSVLERIVTRRLDVPAPRLEELVGAAATEVDWPSEEELARIVEAEAERTVRSAGIALRGFPRALAAVVRPYLDLARHLDWQREHLPTLAAELHGEIELEASGLQPRRIGFRADRVDARGDGLLLSDYKTGTSPFTQKTPAYRYKKLLGEVRRGLRLQPVVYALAVRGGEGFGRLLYLRPRLDGPEESRSVLVTSGDADLRRAFEEAAATTLATWELGLFFPRMEEPGQPQSRPRACRWCRVAEACLRQDSGARRRLRDGMDRLRSGPGSLDERLRRALLDNWWLPAPEQRPEDA